MGKRQRRLGKEFEAEAVRLVETSGRTQREIAEAGECLNFCVRGGLSFTR